MNVASAETAPSSPSGQSPAAGLNVTPSIPTGDIGAFFALFSGFVAKAAADVPAESSPLPQPGELHTTPDGTAKDPKSSKKLPAWPSLPELPGTSALNATANPPAITIQVSQPAVPATATQQDIPQVGSSAPTAAQPGATELPVAPQLISKPLNAPVAFGLHMTTPEPAKPADASVPSPAQPTPDSLANLQTTVSQSTPVPATPAVLPASLSATIAAQPAPSATDSRSLSEPVPAKTDLPLPSVMASRIPSATTVASHRGEQRNSSQQDNGNNQSGSKDSKSRTTDPKPTADRAAVRVQNNPINPITYATTVTAKVLSNGQAQATEDPIDAAKIAADLEIKPATPTQPTRQISVQLKDADSNRVDIQLMERAGKVEVAVRTADRELAKSLQSDLGSLVGKLENKGFKTEAWVPAVAHTAAAALQPASQSSSQGQSGNQGAFREPDRQGQHGSNQRQQQRWAAELEESLDETGENKQ